MSAKKIVQNFYKSDALIDSETMKSFLHPEVILEWNTTKGLMIMDFNKLLDLANKLNKAYVRSKVRISHIVKENDTIALRYTHAVKTIENPREEIMIGVFFVIWELKEEKLFRGYQISQST